ncbi:hypothetical protein, partial [Actinophytocola sp.]|uniref:hypothetical protein n=1 Tax=Actinophytocola sp. TaxID=1872138 RepID=UPI002D6165F5
MTAAAELRAKALEFAAAGRPAEAAKFLHRALRALPVDVADIEAISLRIRVLATLGYTEAEAGSVPDGLVHLGTAHALASGL